MSWDDYPELPVVSAVIDASGSKAKTREVTHPSSRHKGVKLGWFFLIGSVKVLLDLFETSESGRKELLDAEMVWGVC